MTRQYELEPTLRRMNIYHPCNLPFVLFFCRIKQIKNRETFTVYKKKRPIILAIYRTFFCIYVTAFPAWGFYCLANDGL